MEKNINRNEHRKGIIGILAAMVMWGFLPIYWQALRPINSWVIILYRIVLVFVYSVIAARFSYSFKEILEYIYLWCKCRRGSSVFARLLHRATDDMPYRNHIFQRESN